MPTVGQDEIIAVCICTDGRRETLLPCLQSVLDQAPPPEAIVRTVLVDNSGGQEGRRVAAALDVGEALLCVEEPRPGIPAARNRALEAALGIGADWIAFIDDDEIAPRSWIARLLEGARTSRCDVLQGSVAAVTSVEDAITHAQTWQPPGASVAARPRGMAATNNVIIKKWIVAPPMGLRFDEAMTTGGSDGEFFLRARQHGARIMRTVDAPVFEHRPAQRLALAEECRRAFRVGANTNYRYRKNYTALVAAVRLVLRALEKLLMGSWRLIKAAALILLSFQRSIALARKSLADFYFAAGCIGPYLGFAPDRYH
jgi:glycosyltransferase involved in cell wall biosynthesis